MFSISKKNGERTKKAGPICWRKKKRLAPLWVPKKPRTLKEPTPLSPSGAGPFFPEGRTKKWLRAGKERRDFHNLKSEEGEGGRWGNGESRFPLLNPLKRII